MKVSLFILLFALTTGFSSLVWTSANPDAGNDPFKVTLSMSTQKVRATKLSKFGLWIKVVNIGAVTMDTEVYRYELLVNGQPSKAFSLAVGNGKREAKWSALPPGDSVEMSLPSLGPSFFTKPGEYKFQLNTPFAVGEPIPVKVLPN